MRAAIITIGNELLSGSVVDTNASFIAERLFSIGTDVVRMISVGDNESDIRDSLEVALKRADVILTTGGLGPTPDDITTEVVAKTFGRKLLLNEDALARIKELFKKLALEMPSNNEKQAFIPEKSELIRNPIGTACGFMIREKAKLLFFLPGVPKELVRMVDEEVLHIIQREKGTGPRFRTETLNIFGLGESKIAELIQDITEKDKGTNVAFLPHFPENAIKVTAKGTTEQEASEKVSRLVEKIHNRLGDYVFSRGGQTLEGVVGDLLRTNGDTLSVAESCTGGLVSFRLTNVPGSSEYLKTGAVVYSNQAKTHILNVPGDFIEKFGAVSPQVAEKMAQGAREMGQTTLGLAVTGIAGPGGGTPEKPVGLVFISLADKKKTEVKSYNFRGERERIRLITSQAALDTVRRYYLEKNDDTQLFGHRNSS